MLLPFLKRLPFESTFDILFRRGGMADLEALFPGKWLFRFLGREELRDLWTEIVCALRLVQGLRHPAHALYLLHPVVRSIPDSAAAWAVSSRYSEAEWILPVRRDLLIRAMKVFLPRDEPVYDWLDGAELTVRQSPAAWRAMAQRCIDSYRFTARWWATQGLSWVDGPTMGEAIANAAKEEEARLGTALLRLERIQMLELKRARRKEKAAKEEAEGKKKEAKRKTAPYVAKLSPNEEQGAHAQSEQQLARHKQVLQEVRSVLLSDRLPVPLFETALPRVARIVMGLAKQYPKMRWSLKALLHRAAAKRLGLTAWHVERQLCRQASYALKDEPIAALRMLL